MSRGLGPAIQHAFPKPLLVFWAVFVLCSGVVTAPQISDASDMSSCTQIGQALHLGQDWFLNAQKDNGFFHYEYLPHKDSYSDRDNLVRQVGTFWAVSTFLGHGRLEEETLASIHAFRKAIQGRIVYGTVQDTAIAYLEHEGIGKLNTAALYVVALMDLQARGFALSDQEQEDLPKLVNGLKFMASDDGPFWYIYFLPQDKNRITAYGTGEAFFALFKYYNAVNDQDGLAWTWAQFNKYFKNTIQNRTFFDDEDSALKGYLSWSIYALNTSGFVDSRIYRTMMRPVLEDALDFRRQNPNCSHIGCIVTPGIIDATYLEGFVSAYKTAQKYETDPVFLKQIQDYVAVAIDYALDLQITDLKDFESQTGLEFSGKPERLVGGFCTQNYCEMTRNDLNQHVTVALGNYKHSFCPPQDTP